MIKQEFDIEFEKLWANVWEFAPKDDRFDKISTLYWDKLRNQKAKDWAIVVSKLIDNDKKFPTFNRIYALIKEVIGDKKTRDYAECKVCNSSGYVSMLLSFKHNKDNELSIKEKHYWAMHNKQLKLMETTGDRFYGYAYFCRCEKGEDLYLIRGSQGYQLTYEEFNELLATQKGVKI